MTAKQMRAAVVGASTLLGKELIEELNNAPSAAWNITLLDESEEGEAQLISAGDEPAVVQALTRESLLGEDLVFFAGQPQTTQEYWRGAVAGGAAVVDLTGALETENGFLVRSPWISGAWRPDLTTLGVVAAHPAALMVGLAADRLARRFGLEGLTATVLEPASQAGRPGVDELHQQTVSLLSFQSVPKDLYDAQVAFNLQASLGESARVDLAAIRNRIRRDLKALLGADLEHQVRFDLVQAPVFHGYTVSCLVELGVAASEHDVRTALNGGVALAEEETLPSNLAASESGDLLLSVRKEAVDGGGKSFWLWIAADNLRFAARNAVAAALELAALRPSTNVQ
jgi:aspartate-semialdehyde dehydrogenase